MIRTRQAADLDACVAALAEVQKADGYPVSWPRDPHGWLAPPDMHRAWIAVAAGAVLGHVGLVVADLEPEVAEAAGRTRAPTVARLFVTPGGRGRGLAERLLATVRRETEGPLALEVSDEGTAAIALYERTGWRRVATTQATWLNNAGTPAVMYHYVMP
ncbi:GNAT family N-acetyltransferase [Nonomuraea typhae]|uniref:GNAT family N-acetyltransferase n=1 Tax=Nonomuraea typhae TaxID=2603600 RepID=UPI0012FCF646|nr:GNAT family N-acetyltransferase [Nonomuraea typhae]